MKRLVLFMIMACCMLASCVHEPFDNTPRGNMEALWKYMDEHYCYFDYKAEEYGLDWNEVHDRYFTPSLDTLGQERLFNLMCKMLAELRDGHVNLYSVYDVGRYWKWQEDYPVNFYEHIQANYLGTDYKIGGGMRYTILDGNIGYIYYPDFSATVSDGYMNRIFSYFGKCDGIIFDVRGNGGGVVTNIDGIISHFINKPLLCGYLCHKTGPGHSDFSDLEERWIEPSSGSKWLRGVAVLANRGCFSATNTFVSDIKLLPQVKVFGDTTGGGGGLPMSAELPCGWSVRYSSSPMLDIDKRHIEFGVAPDSVVNISDEDFQRGVDTIIECAKKWLISNKK